MDDLLNRVLLLSGGVDSASLLYMVRPSHALFISYGQRAEQAEKRAAAAVAASIDVKFDSVRADFAVTGGGLMIADAPIDGSPSPEWWPFRNQILVTIAAAWACRNTDAVTRPGSTSILLGCVAGDGERHIDGSPRFIAALNDLLRLQEGGVGLEAPAVDLSTEQLVAASGIPDSVLAWTHSCHVANLPCMACPGCFKRERVLDSLQRLQ